MKNTFKIFSLLMMLLLCTALLASCGDALSVKEVEADPYGAIMDASQKQTDAMAEMLSGPEATLKKLAEGVSTYEAELSVPDAAKINLEVVADAKTGAFSGEAAVGAQGVSVTGEIWGDKNQFALSVPMLLGDGTYGVKFDTLAEDLENSSTLAAFGLSWADLKAKLGLDLESMLDKATDSDFQAVLEQYQAECEAIMKEMAPVVAEETVGDVEAVTVTYTYTKETFVKFGEAMDKYLRAILGDLVDMAEIDMDLENMPQSGTYKYYLVKKTGDVQKIEMDMDGMKGTVNYSTDAAKPLDMDFYITTSVEGGLTGTVKGSLREVAEEGKSGIVMDVETSIDGETMPLVLSFIRNDADGKYEMKLAIEGEGEMVIGGELTYTETEVRFTVDKVSIPGKSMDGFRLTASARAGGTVEALPAYKNVLNLTNEDLVAILENLQ